MVIRPEISADADAIRQVLIDAFGSPLEADLAAALRRNCAEALSLTAEDGGVIGHVLFTPVTLHQRGGGVSAGMGLAPLAVAPSRQRQGVGRSLVEAGLRQIAAAGAPFVVVLGEPAYYSRFGFESAGAYGVVCQWPEIPAEYFMLMRLADDALDKGGGTIRYRQEFDDLMQTAANQTQH